MCKAHLGAFAVAPRLLECRSAGERSGEVSCRFVDIARDPALRLFRAALRFERTRFSVEFARAVEQRVAVIYGAARSELLSARARKTSALGSYRKSSREKVPSSAP
jgi:hypothetical protein